MQKLALLTMALFAVLPATSTYQLKSYGFGSGGTVNSSTPTYSLEGTTGTPSGSNEIDSANSTGGEPGYTQTQQANVPKLASLDSNGGSYYNRLHFVIDNQNNPTDATYLLAVSTDNFVSNSNYVQPDGTLSSTVSLADYQTYSAWGGAAGSLMIGLTPNTTYYVKLKATQGKFTESAYGPTSNALTGVPSLSFNLVTSTQPTPPFTVSLGTLNAGNVNTSSSTINTSLSTNSASGGDIYIKGQNGGLLSGSTGDKIAAVTTDLSSASTGFGAQSTSVGQLGGGPFSVVGPYNGSGNNVGIVDNTTRSLYTAGAPVNGGSGVLALKAKAGSADLAASDYQEILTFVAAGNF